MDMKQLVKRIYDHQVRNSIKRGHPEPEYDLFWLQNWCSNDQNFIKLFNRWTETGDSLSVPSIDRIKDKSNLDNKPNDISKELWDRIGTNIHYTKINIQALTYYENTQKYNREISVVVDIHCAKTGKFISTQLSYNEAAREYSVDMSAIRNCCVGRANTFDSGKYFAVISSGKKASLSPRKYKDPELVGVAHRKPVVQLDIETLEFLKLHDSAKYAGLYINPNKKGIPSNITQVCKGNYNPRYGYDWWYKEDYLEYLKEEKLPIPKEIT